MIPDKWSKYFPYPLVEDFYDRVMKELDFRKSNGFDHEEMSKSEFNQLFFDAMTAQRDLEAISVAASPWTEEQVRSAFTHFMKFAEAPCSASAFREAAWLLVNSARATAVAKAED